MTIHKLDADMRRFYTLPEKIAASRIVLDPEQSNHLRSVLRLKVGDEVSVFDGLGSEFLCDVRETGSGKHCSVLNVMRETDPAAPESDLQLTLAPAILKGDKFELVLQKAVELGVTEIRPLLTKRCDVNRSQIMRKFDRFEKIIIESSKQCGRALLMKLYPPADFDEFVRNSNGSKILFAEQGGSQFLSITADKNITAVIGPEGGWEDFEVELALQNGFQIITLGGRILRAETAAISITGLIQNHFGDLN